MVGEGWCRVVGRVGDVVAYFEDVAWGGRCSGGDLSRPHLKSLDDVTESHSSALSFAPK